jgi:FkbM family methyltransferase
VSNLVEYAVKKQFSKLYARAAAAVIRTSHSVGSLLGLGQGSQWVVSRYGVRMRANWRDRTFQYCYFATYGRFLADYLIRFDRDFTFLDIGANQGLYSLLAVRNPRCQAAVALEPVAATFSLLEANVAANDGASKTHCVQAALADRCGEAEISVRNTHSGTATLAGRENFNPAHVQTIRLIDVAALDALLPATGDIVVKVDVEGYEAVVLAQLIRSQHVQRMVVVFYEVDTRWSDSGPLRNLLQAAGFNSFVRHGLGRHYDVLAARVSAVAT